MPHFRAGLAPAGTLLSWEIEIPASRHVLHYILDHLGEDAELVLEEVVVLTLRDEMLHTRGSGNDAVSSPGHLLTLSFPATLQGVAS
jgi:hypothetical protein